MPLNIRQWVELETALRSAYGDYEELRRVVRNTDHRIEDYVANTHQLPTVIERILNAAEQGSWTYDLIRAALAGRATNQLLLDFIANYPEYDPANPPPPPPNYYNAYYVNARYLFIGRKQLREKLRLLREVPLTSRIFLVAGSRVSGKTHTRELISYLASRGIIGRPETHKPIYIDLDKFIYQPYEIVKDIAEKMGLETVELSTIPIQREEQKARYIHNLCNWLHNQVTRTDGRIWWFVFDGFRLNELLPETKDFIGALAERIEKELSEKCYMVLLNYTEILPQEIAFFAEREDVELIGSADLREFFNQLFEDNGKNYAASEIEKMVNEIKRQVDERIAGSSNGDAAKLKTLEEERLRIFTMAVNQAVQRLRQSNYQM